MKTTTLPLTVNLHSLIPCNYQCGFCYAGFASAKRSRIPQAELHEIIRLIAIAPRPPGGWPRKVTSVGGDLRRESDGDVGQEFRRVVDRWQVVRGRCRGDLPYTPAFHDERASWFAVDGTASTRYDTRTPQVPGMWVQIELPAETAITGLRLDTAGSAGDSPRSYKVELSADGQTWGKPVATGEGKPALTEITLPATKTKFIRITQTGTIPGRFWSIHELDVLSDAKGQITEGKATAKLPVVE